MRPSSLSLTAAQAAERVAAGELSSAELFDAYRERAAADRDAGEEGLNCFTWVAPERDGAAGGGAAGRGAARGQGPVLHEGGAEPVRARRSSRATCRPTPRRRSRGSPAAGAPLLAKTNQDEFAMGSSNENSAYGPVRNPWDRARVPGGSSGGSAAAVAAGLAPWALGTDTGGSIRQPAALCGIVGMKPTYGSVSRYGMIAFASSLDQAGPLTRDVRDAALLLSQMVGQDPCDATSLQLPEPIAEPRGERLDGVRIGVPGELTGEGIEAGVLEAFRAALDRAVALGAELEEIALPHAPHGLSAYYVLAPAEASSNLARYDGVRYGLRAPDARELLDMYTRTRHDGFGPEVKRRVMLGTYALSSGYYDAYYGRAQRVRTKIAEDFAAAFERVELIATPTAPTVAFALGEKTGDPLAMYLNDYCTVPMSLAGIPAISIPCGLSDGLPVGLQLAGPAFSENALLGAAHALEQALGFDGSAGRV